MVPHIDMAVTNSLSLRKCCVKQFDKPMQNIL